MSTDIKQLNFSTNWNNKLNCKAFTTIRPYTASKWFEGEHVQVMLNKKYQFTAKIVAINSMTLEKINEPLARVDTGYSATECKDIIRKMYNLAETADMRLMTLTLVKIP